MRGVRRFELVIVAAVVVSAPSFAQAFSGGIAVTTALVRLAGALALCWAVGAIVEGTLDGYARQARQKELSDRIETLRASRAAFWQGDTGPGGPSSEVDSPGTIGQGPGRTFQ